MWFTTLFVGCRFDSEYSNHGTNIISSTYWYLYLIWTELILLKPLDCYLLFKFFFHSYIFKSHYIYSLHSIRYNWIFFRLFVGISPSIGIYQRSCVSAIICRQWMWRRNMAFCRMRMICSGIEKVYRMNTVRNWSICSSFSMQTQHVIMIYRMLITDIAIFTHRIKASHSLSLPVWTS